MNNEQQEMQNRLGQMAGWLNDHTGNYQQCKEVVQILLELGLLAPPETHNESYVQLYESETLATKTNSLSQFLSKFCGNEVKRPDISSQERVQFLTEQLQRQKEEADSEKVRLETQVAALEQKVQLLESEKEFWTQYAKRLMNQTNECRNQAAELTHKILEGYAAFRHEQEQMLYQFKDQVYQACNNSGIEKLSELYVRMAQSETPEVKAYFGRLKGIMTAFGLTPIVPRPGDPFDPRIHEPKVFGQCGGCISKCCEEGWMQGERLVRRAVVETEYE